MRKAKNVVTYRGAVEGLQEEMYCDHLKKLINNNIDFSKRVNFLFKNSHGGSPTVIVKKAKQNSLNSDNNVAIYDRDFKDDFIESINLAKEYNIMSAYSNQNFNYFLILHKKFIYKQTTKSDNYEKELIKTYNLDKNSDIKSKESISKILEQINLEDIKFAIKNINKVNSETERTQKQIAPNIYEQPFLNILEFLEDIFEKII